MTLQIDGVEEKTSIPFYAQYRYDYSVFSEHSFYAKARIGHTWNNGKGNTHVGIGAGYCIVLKSVGVKALNLGLNLILMPNKFRNLDSDYPSYHKDCLIVPSITFGIEF